MSKAFKKQRRQQVAINLEKRALKINLLITLCSLNNAEEMKPLRLEF
ncbi:hypothetical protein LPB85_06035 [Chryseobacterium sp. LC2016-27]|nr:hypothetical protein [Chryseobacterium sp. LC2016-27]